MKKTFFITHQDCNLDGTFGRLRCYKRLAETLADALAQRVEDPEEEHPLPIFVDEVYRISVWV